MKPTKWLVGVVGLAVVAAASCQRQPSREAEQAAIARAQAAAQLLGSRLRERLTTVMKQAGPLAAVEVCAAEAQTLRSTVESETGVRVGRASLKLRNPQDAAPPWVAAWLTAQIPGTPPTGSSTIESGLARVIKPLLIEPACLTCHGDEASLPAEVRSAIQRHYPSDAATGYRLGDLRGALWAEAPLSAAAR